MALVQHSSGSDRWYTPIDIIERSRRVLGHIDLDPASDAFGNSRVRANGYYSEAGLEQRWAGKVFCNPPGGRGSAKKWFQRFISSGIEEGIFIGFSIELMQTCQELLHFDFCVPRRRLKYEKPDSKPKSPPHSSVIVYLGPNPHSFREHFEGVGGVILAPRSYTKWG